MARDPHALKIHIDGSALDNPGGQGGIAAIVEFPDNDDREPELIFRIGYAETTNIRMELLACIKALEWVRSFVAREKVPRVIILTDSTYVAEFCKLAPLWKCLGWRTRDGRPIENEGLWKQLLSVKSKMGVRTDIEWVKGKRTAIAKEVDKEAKRAAIANPQKPDTGFRAGKLSPSKMRGIVATRFPASGQQVVIRVYKKQCIYRDKTIEWKISFEVYSDGTYVAKHTCYCPPEIEQELHRQHHYLVQFNSDRGYPKIERIIEDVQVPV